MSFDNVGVGKLMGEGLTKCLTDAGKTIANVVLINGDPTDNNAALFKEGYEKVIKDNKDYTIVGDQSGFWDATKAGTAFEQLFTQNQGKIDGIVSANDTMAGGIIARFSNTAVLPVTGQDASVEGLQNILAGKQCMTVYKAIKTEADAASKLAISLIKGEDPGALVNGAVQDSVLKKDVKSSLQTPVAIYKDTVKQVIDDGFQKASDVCTAEFKAACDAAGIK